MKTRIILFQSIVSVLVVLIATSCTNIISEESPYLESQENLAHQLGVRIEDYPSEYVFPKGYYFTILNQDMTIQEVHNTITGYQKVLRCDEYREVYYYFSNDDLEAIRFEVLYDDGGMFLELIGEDTDSRTIWTEGCEAGLIDSNK